MNIFHERLKETLKVKNVSQTKLGQILGVSQAYVSKITGRDVPTLERFKQICEVLEVSADYLLGLNPTGGGYISNIFSYLDIYRVRDKYEGMRGRKKGEGARKFFLPAAGRRKEFTLVTRIS